MNCNLSFKTSFALKRHKAKCTMQKVENGSTVEESDAMEIFKHTAKYFPVKPYKCNMCKRFFKTNESRRIHSMNCTSTDAEEMALTCKICNGTYANKSALIKHEQAHEKDLGRLERLESLIDFSTITPLDNGKPLDAVETSNDVVEPQNPVQVHDTDKPKDNSENWKVVHKCDECDRKFGTIRDLRNHQSGHRKGKVTYDCDQCSKVYINKIALYRHQQVHSKSGLYTCKVCNRDYSSLDNLIKHGKVHQGDPPFRCDICNKGFYEKRYLQWHVNAHLKIKPYMCDQCGKAFPRPGQLREHRRVHSDERPYKCDICGKCFKLYDTMRNHKDTHNTLQNFVCHTCGRRFNRAYNLRKHQKIHSEVASYICDECGKGFKNSTALKSHFIAFHLKPEDVKHCKYTVHQCEYCFKPFAEKVDRDCHMRTHTGEKPFSCEICGKTFANKSNMRSHIRNHQGEKSKLCNICGKGFSFNRDLKKHMVSHNKSNDDLEKQKAIKKPAAAAVRPQSNWADCQHAPPPPPPPQAQQAPRQYHHDNVSPRHQEQLQQSVMEASAEALSAAYALTMAREATMQQMGNPGASSEFSWQFL